MVTEGRFGEARGAELDLRLHKANHGGGLSYALAALSGEPRLFKGNDFKLTDVEAV